MKRLSIGIVLAVFLLTAAFTAVFGARPPGCNTCKKDGCPAGKCYIDCVGCCFYAPDGGILCYR